MSVTFLKKYWVLDISFFFLKNSTWNNLTSQSPDFRFCTVLSNLNNTHDLWDSPQISLFSSRIHYSGQVVEVINVQHLLYKAQKTVNTFNLILWVSYVLANHNRLQDTHLNIKIFWFCFPHHKIGFCCNILTSTVFSVSQ